MRITAVAVVVAAVAACSSSSAQDALQSRLTLPAGFAIAEFAKVGGARFMALGPDGAVYVSRPADNEIVRLFDSNGDGVAESKSVAVSGAGLNRPHGVAIRPNEKISPRTGHDAQHLWPR